MAKRYAHWIEDGEKYALIGLNLYTEGKLARLNFPGGLFALPNAEFKLPEFWREWLGTARVEEIEECTLYLLAKLPSKNPEIIDGENDLLQERVHDFFLGLTLSSKFTAFSSPFIATGSRFAGEIDVRTFGALGRPAGSIVVDTAPVGEGHLRQAAEIARALKRFHGPWQTDHWRFFRCYGIYQAARANLDMLDRIHQFTRCIEGLIASKKGDTRRQFKSRTEVFIGTGHHELMGELYDVRSDIEHLHEHKHLGSRDRATRIRLAELEAVSEWVARSCLTRILLCPDLIKHFGSVDALNQFWAKPPTERQALWGMPVDPRAQLLGFNFDHVSQEALGAERP